ncbi:hypothetical protein R3W88_016452 [Solanum pinnatisectum]|uniref:Uncharacterized protein n=1 Tax=Solanum pinnatisectum TaxID=50273 RepID=A0AAV9KZY0_9SOLN|nr:hypothetical protein R3W88_016452 [Solanum pinnatisectum]
MHSVSPIDNISALFQKQLLPNVQSMLSDRLFRIQLRKSYWRDSYVPNIPLSVLSYTEKEVIFPPTVDDKIKKVKPRSTSEIALEPYDVLPDYSSFGLKIESSTPVKGL